MKFRIGENFLLTLLRFHSQFLLSDIGLVQRLNLLADQALKVNW